MNLYLSYLSEKSEISEISENIKLISSLIGYKVANHPDK